MHPTAYTLRVPGLFSRGHHLSGRRRSPSQPGRRVMLPLGWSAGDWRLESGDWRPETEELSSSTHLISDLGSLISVLRPEIGDRLALGGPSTAVHGQAVGMGGVAGLPRLVRSGSAGGGAAQHSVQPTGEDLGRLRMLAAPAADGGR